MYVIYTIGKYLMILSFDKEENIRERNLISANMKKIQ